MAISSVDENKIMAIKMKVFTSQRVSFALAALVFLDVLVLRSSAASVTPNKSGCGESAGGASGDDVLRHRQRTRTLTPTSSSGPTSAATEREEAQTTAGASSDSTTLGAPLLNRSEQKQLAHQGAVGAAASGSTDLTRPGFDDVLSGGAGGGDEARGGGAAPAPTDRPPSATVRSDGFSRTMLGHVEAPRAPAPLLAGAGGTIAIGATNHRGSCAPAPPLPEHLHHQAADSTPCRGGTIRGSARLADAGVKSLADNRARTSTATVIPATSPSAQQKTTSNFLRGTGGATTATVDPVSADAIGGGEQHQRLSEEGGSCSVRLSSASGSAGTTYYRSASESGTSASAAREHSSFSSTTCTPTAGGGGACSTLLTASAGATCGQEIDALLLESSPHNFAAFSSEQELSDEVGNTPTRSEGVGDHFRQWSQRLSEHQHGKTNEHNEEATFDETAVNSMTARLAEMRAATDGMESGTEFASFRDSGDPSQRVVAPGTTTSSNGDRVGAGTSAADSGGGASASSAEGARHSGGMRLSTDGSELEAADVAVDGGSGTMLSTSSAVTKSAKPPAAPPGRAGKPPRMSPPLQPGDRGPPHHGEHKNAAEVGESEDAPRPEKFELPQFMETMLRKQEESMRKQEQESSAQRGPHDAVVQNKMKVRDVAADELLLEAQEGRGSLGDLVALVPDDSGGTPPGSAEPVPKSGKLVKKALAALDPRLFHSEGTSFSATPGAQASGSSPQLSIPIAQLYGFGGCSVSSSASDPTSYAKEQRARLLGGVVGEAAGPDSSGQPPQPLPQPGTSPSKMVHHLDERRFFSEGCGKTLASDQVLAGGSPVHSTGGNGGTTKSLSATAVAVEGGVLAPNLPGGAPGPSLPFLRHQRKTWRTTGQPEQLHQKPPKPSGGGGEAGGVRAPPRTTTASSGGHQSPSSPSDGGGFIAEIDRVNLQTKLEQIQAARLGRSERKSNSKTSNFSGDRSRTSRSSYRSQPRSRSPSQKSASSCSLSRSRMSQPRLSSSSFHSGTSSRSGCGAAAMSKTFSSNSEGSGTGGGGVGAGAGAPAAATAAGSATPTNRLKKSIRHGAGPNVGTLREHQDEDIMDLLEVQRDTVQSGSTETVHSGDSRRSDIVFREDMDNIGQDWAWEQMSGAAAQIMKPQGTGGSSASGGDTTTSESKVASLREMKRKAIKQEIRARLSEIKANKKGGAIGVGGGRAEPQQQVDRNEEWRDRSPSFEMAVGHPNPGFAGDLGGAAPSSFLSQRENLNSVEVLVKSIFSSTQERMMLQEDPDRVSHGSLAGGAGAGASPVLGGGTTPHGQELHPVPDSATFSRIDEQSLESAGGAGAQSSTHAAQSVSQSAPLPVVDENHNRSGHKNVEGKQEEVVPLSHHEQQEAPQEARSRSLSASSSLTREDFLVDYTHQQPYHTRPPDRADCSLAPVPASGGGGERPPQVVDTGFARSGSAEVEGIPGQLPCAATTGDPALAPAGRGAKISANRGRSLGESSDSSHSSTTSTSGPPPPATRDEGDEGAVVNAAKSKKVTREIETQTTLTSHDGRGVAEVSRAACATASAPSSSSQQEPSLVAQPRSLNSEMRSLQARLSKLQIVKKPLTKPSTAVLGKAESLSPSCFRRDCWGEEFGSIDENQISLSPTKTNIRNLAVDGEQDNHNDAAAAAEAAAVEAAFLRQRGRSASEPAVRSFEDRFISAADADDAGAAFDSDFGQRALALSQALRENPRQQAAPAPRREQADEHEEEEDEEEGVEVCRMPDDGHGALRPDVWPFASSGASPSTTSGGSTSYGEAGTGSGTPASTSYSSSSSSSIQQQLPAPDAAMAVGPPAEPPTTTPTRTLAALQAHQPAQGRVGLGVGACRRHGKSKRATMERMRAYHSLPPDRHSMSTFFSEAEEDAWRSTEEGLYESEGCSVAGSSVARAGVGSSSTGGAAAAAPAVLGGEVDEVGNDSQTSSSEQQRRKTKSSKSSSKFQSQAGNYSDGERSSWDRGWSSFDSFTSAKRSNSAPGDIDESSHQHAAGELQGTSSSSGEYTAKFLDIVGGASSGDFVEMMTRRNAERERLRGIITSSPKARSWSCSAAEQANRDLQMFPAVEGNGSAVERTSGGSRRSSTSSSGSGASVSLSTFVRNSLGGGHSCTQEGRGTPSPPSSSASSRARSAVEMANLIHHKAPLSALDLQALVQHQSATSLQTPAGGGPQLSPTRSQGQRRLRHYGIGAGSRASSSGSGVGETGSLADLRPNVIGGAAGGTSRSSSTKSSPKCTAWSSGGGMLVDSSTQTDLRSRSLLAISPFGGSEGSNLSGRSGKSERDRKRPILPSSHQQATGARGQDSSLEPQPRDTDTGEAHGSGGLVHTPISQTEASGSAAFATSGLELSESTSEAPSIVPIDATASAIACEQVVCGRGGGSANNPAAPLAHSDATLPSATVTSLSNGAAVGDAPALDVQLISQGRAAGEHVVEVGCQAEEGHQPEEHTAAGASGGFAPLPAVASEEHCQRSLTAPELGLYGGRIEVLSKRHQRGADHSSSRYLEGEDESSENFDTHSSVASDSSPESSTVSVYQMLPNFVDATSDPFVPQRVRVSKSALRKANMVVRNGVMMQRWEEQDPRRENQPRAGPSRRGGAAGSCTTQKLQANTGSQTDGLDSDEDEQSAFYSEGAESSSHSPCSPATAAAAAWHLLAGNQQDQVPFPPPARLYDQQGRPLEQGGPPGHDLRRHPTRVAYGMEGGATPYSSYGDPYNTHHHQQDGGLQRFNSIHQIVSNDFVPGGPRSSSSGAAPYPHSSSTYNPHATSRPNKPPGRSQSLPAAMCGSVIRYLMCCRKGQRSRSAADHIDDDDDVDSLDDFLRGLDREDQDIADLQDAAGPGPPSSTSCSRGRRGGGPASGASASAAAAAQGGQPPALDYGAAVFSDEDREALEAIGF